MMKKLLLHMGPHKTGTTAIQEFFSDRRSELKKLGILYPETACHGNQHSLLPGIYLKKHRSLPEARVRSLSDIVTQLRKEASEADSLLMSSEAFWELATSNTAAFVSVLKALSTEFETRIIYSIRNPGEQRWSAIQHQLRIGSIFDTFDSFRNGTQVYYQKVEKSLGKHYPNAISFVYDKADQVGQFVGSCSQIAGFHALNELNLAGSALLRPVRQSRRST